MKQNKNPSLKIIQEDPLIAEKIELFIQQSENETIPTIVFEYFSKERF